LPGSAPADDDHSADAKSGQVQDLLFIIYSQTALDPAEDGASAETMLIKASLSGLGVLRCLGGERLSAIVAGLNSQKH
jgi:hypothetical protein